MVNISVHELADIDDLIQKIAKKSAVFDDPELDEINKLANKALERLADLF